MYVFILHHILHSTTCLRMRARSITQKMTMYVSSKQLMSFVFMISKFLQVYFPPPLPMFNYILMKYVCIFCILIASHKTIPNCSHCSNTNTSQAYNNNYIPCLLYQLTQNNELNKNQVNLIYLKNSGTDQIVSYTLL